MTLCLAQPLMSWLNDELREHPGHRCDAGGVPRADVLVEELHLQTASTCPSPRRSHVEMCPYVASAAALFESPRSTAYPMYVSSSSAAT